MASGQANFRRCQTGLRRQQVFDVKTASSAVVKRELLPLSDMIQLQRGFLEPLEVVLVFAIQTFDLATSNPSIQHNIANLLLKLPMENLRLELASLKSTLGRTITNWHFKLNTNGVARLASSKLIDK